MTVNYRTSLTSSDRFSYETIIKQTLIKMGVISLYDDVDDDQMNLIQDVILDTTLQVIDSGLLGSFRTRRVYDNDYKAKPWDHIMKMDGSGNMIDDEPDNLNLNNQYSPANPDGSSNAQLPVSFPDGMGVMRYVRDMDCIKITSHGSTMYLMFDGNKKLWNNINEPIFSADSVPLSTLDREGYIADLYLKLAPYFGVDESTIPSTIVQAQLRWKNNLVTRAASFRDGEQSFLFGSISDEYYRDRYTNVNGTSNYFDYQSTDLY